MATLRQQLATNVLTATKFRDLLKTVGENRPNDDLSIIQKAYDFSLQHHEGQKRASGESVGCELCCDDWREPFGAKHFYQRF